MQDSTPDHPLDSVTLFHNCYLKMTRQPKNYRKSFSIFNPPSAKNKHLLLGQNVDESAMLGKRNPFPQTRNLEKISSHIFTNLV